MAAASSLDREKAVERVNLIALSMRRMPWANAILVLGMATFIYPYVEPLRFAIWGIASFAVEAARATYAMRLVRSTRAIDPRRAHTLLVLQAGVAGAVLGASAVLFLPRLPVVDQALLGVILFAVPAVGAVVSQASRFMIAAYSFCILVPAAITWMGLHPDQALAVAGLTVLYCVVLALAADDGDKLLARSVEIRHERDRLVRDLEARNAEVHAAVARADQAAQARTRVMAAASHDLRQPLQALSVYSAVLATNPPPESQRELAANIEQIVRSVGHLVHGLLDLSQLAAGQLVLERRPVAIDVLVTSVCAEFEPAAAERGIDLRVNAHPVVAIGDALAITRIIRNLLDNALKYTEWGDVTVSTTTDLRGGLPAAVLRVADTGRGIPASEHHKIFEEFYQIDNPGRDRNKGVGLGLAIVKRLCELSGGQIAVESEVGRGTTFRVCLPLGSQAYAPPETREPATKHVSLRNRRIVVIDDEVLITRGMHRLLSDWGVQPSTANSLADAERLLREQGPPDLLVTDLRLGGRESGAAFAARMQRELGAFPVLVITGETIAAAQQEANRYGFRLLHKPIAAERLKQAMGKLLQPHAAACVEDPPPDAQG